MRFKTSRRREITALRYLLVRCNKLTLTQPQNRTLLIHRGSPFCCIPVDELGHQKLSYKRPSPRYPCRSHSRNLSTVHCTPLPDALHYTTPVYVGVSLETWITLDLGLLSALGPWCIPPEDAVIRAF